MVPLLRSAFCAAACWLSAAVALAQSSAHPVVTSTPDLAVLVREIGGERVDVVSLARGPQDPHYLDPRPSMLYSLQRAELLLETGRGLESGWLPVLQRSCRNPAVLAGQLGYLDASRAVRALGVPGNGIDRTAGDLHMAGNPHYLLDPLCGFEVATLVRDRCAALWPVDRETFDANLADFRRRLAVAMVGEQLAPLYDHDVEQLAKAFASGVLHRVLAEQGDAGALGGWFGMLQPYRSAKVIVDHDLWPYFTERFGLVVFGFLEPKPGVTPSTAHLTTLAERMRAGGVYVVLAAPYFPLQYAAVLQREAGARIAAVAHQPGARPHTEDYLSFVAHNVHTIAAALAAGPDRKAD